MRYPDTPCSLSNSQLSARTPFGSRTHLKLLQVRHIPTDQGLSHRLTCRGHLSTNSRTLHNRVRGSSLFISSPPISKCLRQRLQDSFTGTESAALVSDLSSQQKPARHRNSMTGLWSVLAGRSADSTCGCAFYESSMSRSSTVIRFIMELLSCRIASASSCFCACSAAIFSSTVPRQIRR